MIVCICHRVSDRDIAREARSGCASFDDLQDDLRVGTACGACLEAAQASFAEHAGMGGLRAGAQACCPGACPGTCAGRSPLAGALSSTLHLGAMA